MSRYLTKFITCREQVKIFELVSKERAFSTATSSKSNEYDMVIVGGGIVGTATARELKERYPNLKVAVLEKEKELAKHQSGRNSGVIHAGIYYKPGSLKAKLCVEGLHLSYKYCDSKGIPYRKVGKLIVATTPLEVKRLHDLYERGTRNNVPDLKLLKGEKEIKEVEPHCRGLEAIWSPHTGIVDWGLVTKQYGKDLQEQGGDIHLSFQVSNFRESRKCDFPIEIESSAGKSVTSKYVLTCGGLQSDLLAELSGCSKVPRIVPFRGEYLLLNPKKVHLVRGNIYPVPDPRVPFLGVHFTPRMDGSVWLGPNAILAFQREGYKWTDINFKELTDAVAYPGFIKMALKYLTAGTYEISKSLFPTLQVQELQKFIPAVTKDDILPGPAGVRAQALDIQGNLVEDFYFDINKKEGSSGIGERILHCRNAPSPGATSSLAIAKMMVDKLESEFLLKG